MAHAYDRLKNCLSDVKEWLSANKLKLNPDKTEIIIFGSKTHMKNSTNLSQLVVLAISSLLLRNLGAWLDRDFSCFAQIRDLKHLRGMSCCSYGCECFGWVQVYMWLKGYILAHYLRTDNQSPINQSILAQLISKTGV